MNLFFDLIGQEVTQVYVEKNRLTKLFEVINADSKEVLGKPFKSRDKALRDSYNRGFRLISKKDLGEKEVFIKQIDECFQIFSSTTLERFVSRKFDTYEEAEEYCCNKDLMLFVSVDKM